MGRGVLNHPGPGQYHAKTWIAPGTSYSARGTGACPTENIETLEYLKWHFQHFEKAKSVLFHSLQKKDDMIKIISVAGWTKFVL